LTTQATIDRLRTKRDIWNRALESARRTLVIVEAPGVVTVVVNATANPELFRKATDPSEGARFLRDKLGVDPSRVQVMADVPDCLPAEWTAEDELALATAEDQQASTKGASS
jgi:hypothetical protein